jgi:hypothetical protein
LEVVEGLAQFYTQVVAERLAPRTPGLKTAYEALLSLQGGPYLAHQEWLKGDRRQRGEVVRFALIAARSRGGHRPRHVAGAAAGDQRQPDEALTF